MTALRRLLLRVAGVLLAASVEEQLTFRCETHVNTTLFLHRLHSHETFLHATPETSETQEIHVIWHEDILLVKSLTHEIQGGLATLASQDHFREDQTSMAGLIEIGHMIGASGTGMTTDMTTHPIMIEAGTTTATTGLITQVGIHHHRTTALIDGIEETGRTDMIVN